MTRRGREVNIVDAVLGNPHVAHTVMSYLDLTSRARLSLMVSQEIRSFDLNQFIDSAVDLGQYSRVGFLKGMQNGVFMNLQRLALTGNIRSQSCQHLAMAFKNGNCQRLEVLQLDECLSNPLSSHTLFDAMEEAGPYRLQELRVSYGAIPDDGIGSVVGALAKCPRLRVLHLPNTPLQLTAVIHLATSLRDRVWGGQLESLQLYGKLTSGTENAHLASAFRQGSCPRLRELDLKGTLVEAAGAQVLLDGLGHGCPLLEALGLAGSALGPEGTMMVAASIHDGRLACLKSLDLRANMMDDIGCLALAEMMKRGALSKLKTLQLGANHIGTMGMQGLARALQSESAPILTGLNLSLNPIGPDLGLELMESISSRQKSIKTSGMEKLDLFATLMGGAGTRALALGLQSGLFTSLKVLRLGDHAKVTRGLHAIALALSTGACPQLEELDLARYREATIRESHHAAEMLWGAVGQHMSGSLKSCRLAYVFVGHKEGAQAMSAAVQRCKVLEILHVDQADLGAEGVIALSSALESRPIECARILELCLAGNGAGDKGVEALSRALAVGPTLRHLRLLRLADNNLTPPSAQSLSQSFRKGGASHLHYLDLGSNPLLGDKGASILAQALCPEPPVPATTPTTTTDAQGEGWASSVLRSCKRRLVGLWGGEVPPAPPALTQQNSGSSIGPPPSLAQQTSTVVIAAVAMQHQQQAALEQNKASSASSSSSAEDMGGAAAPGA